jgi:GNAT superfamily N-acetyltransferase
MERDTGRPRPVTPDDLDLRLTDAPSDELRDVAGNGLLAFNVELLGSPNRRPLGIAIHARQDGKLLGGLYGRTGYRRLFVELLFVPSELRGLGLGATLLRQAEAEAKARDCIGA